MKKLLLTLLPCYLLSDTSATEQIAHKLALLEAQIHHPLRQLQIPYDPFHPGQHVQKRKNTKSSYQHRPKQHAKPVLSMIFDKKAFINGKWVKENQKIADYVVTKISEDTVFLRKGRKIIKLSLSENDGILIAKEE
jgi:hypothetical protein